MSLLSMPRLQHLDLNGTPYPSAKASFYASGTDTPVAVYTDALMNVAHPATLTQQADGYFLPIYVDPADGDLKVIMTDSAGGNSRTIDPVNPQFDISLIEESLNPATDGEDVAGVTVVNFNYPPGCWDRYGTNTTSGTTDMTAAANAAYRVANETGCDVTFGATAPYRLNSPVNCTGIRGITTTDLSSCDASSGEAAIIVGHTGHGFDLATSTEMTFRDMTAKNLSGTVPKTLFFMARNTIGSGAGQHRFVNVRTTSAAKFDNMFYQYGAEENQYWSCILYNTQDGSAIINVNGTNPAGYSSTFVTIATGAQSNAEHRMFGCNLFNAGNSGSANEVCVQLERALNFSWSGGLWYCPNGAAYVRLIGSTACNFLTLENIRGETDGSVDNTYGILVSTTGTTGADSHVYWDFKQLGLMSAGAGLRFDDGAEIQEMDIHTVAVLAGHLLDVYNMRRCRIRHGQSIVTGRALGTVESNHFIGTRANITLSGTDSKNTGVDMATGTTWETDDNYTSAATACTGAITASVQYALRKQQKTVTLTLPSISATATAAASFVIGPTIPAAYRPAADVTFLIAVRDNGNILNVPGKVVVSSAGVITVSKDIVGTGNYTAAAGAGIATNTNVSWNQ